MAFHVAVYPIGKLDVEELEHALSRVAKVLGSPVELRGAVPVPAGIEDPARRQFRAGELLRRLRVDTTAVGAGRWIGGGAGTPPPSEDARVCVTDVDLFTAKSDGVFAALNGKEHIAVVSLRRLREPYYKRKADPEKQRSRLAREIVRMAGRLLGAPECGDPACALGSSRSVADVDVKNDAFCRACSERLFQGRQRLG